MTRFLPGYNKHNNNGNIYCDLPQDVVDSVLTFIRYKGATEGEVYATRVIRSLGKGELWDEEKGAVDLPSNTTKREMYELYCFNRGWTVKSNNKGRYPNVVDYNWRKVDNMFGKQTWNHLKFVLGGLSGTFGRRIFPTSVFTAHVMAHAVNVQYFEMLFVIVLPRWERLMMMCLMANPPLKSNQPLTTKPPLMVKHFLTRMISILLLMMMLDVLIRASSKNGSSNPLGSILPWKKECVAKSKRQQSAPSSATTTKFRTRTLTMCLFASMRRTCCCHITVASSPEKSIISPPWQINLFGIVDLSRTPNKFNCYAYMDFTGKKRSNNAASLLLQELDYKFWLRKGSHGKSLMIAMYNCGGQDKNNVVLRLAPYWVEMGYFLKVESAFYIPGHTNNACDRTYNQMNPKYHKKDIFTW
jgi:hypothetical protein